MLSSLWWGFIKLMNSCHAVPDLYSRSTNAWLKRILNNSNCSVWGVDGVGGVVKLSLIGNWKVISILVFWVSQWPNVLQLLMMSCWVKKTRRLCWAANKQEQSGELNRKEKQGDVRPPVLLPAGTPLRGTWKLNTNKVNMHTWHHCPLPGLIMVMHWDN